MSPSIGGCSSTFGNLVSLSFLIFYFCFLICLSCKDDVCGVSTLYLLTCTNVSIVDGAPLLLIIFWALAFVISFFFLTPDLEAPPSSILFFLFRALLKDFVTVFLLFSNVLHLFSGFLDLSLWFLWTIFLLKKQIFKNLC